MVIHYVIRIPYIYILLFPRHCQFPEVTRYMSSQKHAIVETNHEHVHHPTHHKNNWLVVSTPLKNISQWEGLSDILWKIKNVPNHQPDKVNSSQRK